MQALKKKTPEYSINGIPMYDINSVGDLINTYDSEHINYDDVEQTCSICLNKISDKMISTTCNHHFHTFCINTWIADGRQTCPICNRIIYVHIM